MIYAADLIEQLAKLPPKVWVLEVDLERGCVLYGDAGGSRGALVLKESSPFAPLGAMSLSAAPTSR